MLQFVKQVVNSIFTSSALWDFHTDRPPASRIHSLCVYPQYQQEQEGLRACTARFLETTTTARMETTLEVFSRSSLLSSYCLHCAHPAAPHRYAHPEGEKVSITIKLKANKCDAHSKYGDPTGPLLVHLKVRGYIFPLQHLVPYWVLTGMQTAAADFSHLSVAGEGHSLGARQ